MAAKTYLVVYNIASAVGWSYVLYLAVAHLSSSSSAAAVTATTASSSLAQLLARFKAADTNLLLQRATTTYNTAGWATAAVQTAAILEVIHVLFGWVRSPLGTTAIQVASRLYLVWGITEQFQVARTSPIYTSMILAWSITEVIRYSFYATSLIGSTPHLLLWLRYTTFYLLYPLGAGSEATLIYLTLPKSSPYPSWQSWLHGMWGPTDYVRGVFFLIWWPGLYVMYTYMMKQRRKVLGKKSKTQ